MTEGQLSFADLENWEIPPVQGNSVEIDSLNSPIWTETKAQLIRNYLRLFLFITKHGAYIDGFAGPQDAENPDSWAAKLVLEMTPTWMNSFYLSEVEPTSYTMLADLVRSQSTIRGRSITHKCIDFNVWVDEILGSGSIRDSTATFALLDQRSTECKWATVEKLAKHKKGDTKVELFYFFPTGWIHRTLSETRDNRVLDDWWGDDSWKQLQEVGQAGSAQIALERIQKLGYRDVKSWPICSKKYGTGKTMYHMIHATDHLEAPKLMFRAYNNLIQGVPPDSQLKLPNI